MTTGKVYFVECAGRIKIGYTQDVASRLKSLATGAPAEMSILATVDGTVNFERAIHKDLAAYRVKGEWFRDCSEVRSLMADVVARGALAIGFVEPEVEQTRVSVAPPQAQPEPSTGTSVLRPIYKRIDACMERYVGDNVAESIKREKALMLREGELVNRVIGGYYSLRRTAFAFNMIHHTLDCMDDLLDVVRDTIYDRSPIDQKDLVPRASYYAERLEHGLHRLFENPDAAVIDVSGFEGMSLRDEAPEPFVVPPPIAATEFCHL